MEESRKWREGKITGRNALYLCFLPTCSISKSMEKANAAYFQRAPMLCCMSEKEREIKKKTVKHCPVLAAIQGSLIIKASSRQNVLYSTKHF